MYRRSYLRAVGLAAAGGVAGCLGGGGGESNANAANEYGYDTTRTNGVDVPLVPVTDAHEWFQSGDDVVFADARGETQYRKAHVAGAVLSPAPDGQGGGDPVEEESTSTRIVTYCGCPHHLSTMRGASLIEDGYAHTYAIDEGFGGWRDAGYPVEGQDTAANPAEFTIEGRSDPSLADEFAWVRHDDSGQREAAPIDEDGRFTLNVHFYGVGPGTNVRVSTPRAEVTDSLRRLTSAVVDL